MWGSVPKLGVLLGNDNNAISRKDDSIIKFNKALKYYSNRGFKLYKEDNNPKKKEIIIGNGLSSFTLLKKNLKKHKKLHEFAININNKLNNLGIYL